MKNQELLHTIEEKTLHHIRQHKMISAHETILLGVSGGADSMCLLFLLKKLSDKLGCQLHVVHVNHMLRASAKRDEDFVLDTCKRLQIPCHVRQVDVPRFVKEQGLSVEEAARILRYEAFEEIRQTVGAAKIAVAHHSQDQAETVLFHLCRGAGLEGLSGIWPVRGDIIRPLLLLSRQEIEDYLSLQEISYMTDETNLDTAYARNALRSEVFPVLEEKICQGSGMHMARTAERLQLAQDYLAGQIQTAYEQCVTKQGESWQVSLPELKQLHSYLQTEVIRMVLSSAAGSRKDLGAVHVEAVLDLAGKQVGRLVHLPYDITVSRSYDALVVQKGNSPQHQSRELILELPDKVGGQKCYEMPDGRYLSLRVFANKKDADIPTKAYTKWLDHDKIKAPLLLRTVRETDYFYFDDDHTKTVKDYMKDEKIPQSERKGQMVIASGDHMLYYLGKRISNYYKVTKETTYILEIEIGSDHKGGTLCQKQSEL